MVNVEGVVNVETDSYRSEFVNLGTMGSITHCCGRSLALRHV